MASSLSISNHTRRKAPRVPFARALEEALPGWELSLVFVGPTEAKRLNQTLRQKDYVPNVLSYEVGKKHGEILICLAEAEKQAPTFGRSPAHFALLLFIHGCLHLKGGVHGATMERREQELLAKFAKTARRAPLLPLHGTTHRNRNRHRHLPGKAGGGRGGRG